MTVGIQKGKEDGKMQNRKRIYWALTPVLAGSLLMAGGACNRSSVEGKMESNTTITKADQDRTVNVVKGGQVTVKLVWSPGTGYDWILTRNDPSMLQQDGEARTEPAKEPMPGAAETRVFLFKALKSGSTSLEFQSRQPFEKEARSADVFRVQVVISD